MLISSTKWHNPGSVSVTPDRVSAAIERDLRGSPLDRASGEKKETSLFTPQESKAMNRTERANSPLLFRQR